ncbi:probable glutathione S-transferase [Impatiens glandulifera]|uniref:probable glutathione S-transferase n=1 Tax=Impatiens glandulifera TaxID=253017 RepID=UPI001FB14BC4|nr:probable glutathione S-transferase [Impatiens glandulifera]
MESDQELKLVGFWPSPFVIRVKWALELKGLNYTYIEDDIFNKSPLLLQLNPVQQRVPVLVHLNKPIPESPIILQYIHDTWTDHNHTLLPSDPHLKAHARFWATVGDHKLLEYAWMAMICSKGEEKEGYVQSAIEVLGLIQEELKNDFFGGESIGYLDLVLGWISYWLPVWEEVGSMKILDEAQFPVIYLWAKRFMDHPKIEAHLPPRDQMLVYFEKRRIQLKLAWNK